MVATLTARTEETLARVRRVGSVRDAPGLFRIALCSEQNARLEAKGKSCAFVDTPNMIRPQGAAQLNLPSRESAAQLREGEVEESLPADLIILLGASGRGVPS